MPPEGRRGGNPAVTVLATVALSLMGSVVIAFFFVNVFLKEVAAFDVTDSLMFVAPLFVGFLYGLMVADREIHYALFATIMTTLFTVLLIWAALFSPVLFGTGVMLTELSGWAIKDIMLAGIVTFPLVLVATVVGKFFGESSLYSEGLKRERESLRKETVEWYAMLETVEGDKLKDDLEAPLEWQQTGPGAKPVELPNKDAKK
jgi:hypothetical protein